MKKRYSDSILNCYSKVFVQRVTKIALWLAVVTILVAMVETGWGQTATQNFGVGATTYSSQTGSTATLPNPSGSGTTYARGGANAPNAPIVLANTSNPLGTTGSYVRGVASSTGSVSKFSPILSYTGSTEFYTSFKVLFGDASAGSTATSGIWTFYQGAGAMYSDNNNFTGTQVFTALRFTYATGGTVNLTYRAGGSFVTTSLTNSTFSESTVYTVEIVGNNKTSGTINYSYGGVAQTVAVQKFDLYVNGTLIGNDLAESQLPANSSINSNAFIGENSVSNIANIFVDDVIVYNAVPAAIVATTNLYWGGTTGTYTGTWTSGTPWGTSSSSGAGTAWPASGSFNGNFNANPGTVTVPASISVVPAAAIVNSTGTTTFTTSGVNGVLTAPVVLTSTLTTAPVSGTSLSLSGVLSSTDGIVQNGAGTTILSGANTYTGSTTITDGTLSLGAAGSGANSPLGTVTQGTTVSAGGSLDLNGFSLATAEALSINGTGYSNGGALKNSAATAATWTGSLELASNSSIDAGGTITVTGTVSGSDLLTKTGTGTLELGAASPFSGPFTVSAGKVTLKVNSALASVTVITVDNGGTLETIHTGLTNAINDAAAISLNGTGVLNTSGGSETVGSVASASTTSSIIVGDNGAVAGSFTVGDAANASFSGIISGFRATTSNTIFTKRGTGTLTLSGNNSFSGVTSITAGTIKLGVAGSGGNSPLGTTSGGTTVSSGAALDLNGFSLATAEPLTLNGTGISSGGALANSSASSATYTGAIVLAANSRIGTSGDIVLSGNISGAFGLTKSGTASLFLTGANTNTSNSVAQGTLFVNGSGSLSGTTAVSTGATLGGTGTAGGAVSISGSIAPGAASLAIGTLSAGSAVNFNTSSSIDIDLANVSGNPGTEWDRLLATGAITVGSFVVVNLTVASGSGFVNTNTYSWPIMQGASISALPTLINVTGISYTGTFSFLNSGTVLSIVYTPPGSATISTTVAAYGPFCNNVSQNISVAFATTGTFTGSFYVQLSNASGAFPLNSTSNIISSAAVSSPIAATIPAGQAAGSGYRVRVVNTAPVVQSGNNNGSNIVINSAASITTDIGNKSVPTGAATSFMVVASGSISSYKWQVSEDGGTSWIDLVGGVYSGTTTATLSISNVTGLTGNKYRVLISALCGSVVSAEAILTVYTPGSIWTNPITASNPSAANPFTSGQTVASNLNVSGLLRSTGLSASAGVDRFNAADWSTGALDPFDYFEFTLTPAAGYQLNLSSFIYTSEATATGPISFSFGSSLDGFTEIAAPSANGASYSLSSSQFQDITTAISFRIYGYNAGGTTGTFSINDFTFSGSVVAVCSLPVAPQANANATPQTINVNPGCFNAYWNTITGATGGYYLDVSTYANFATPGTAATDLFISEYVEGSSTNKYIEIYNGTGSSVNLTNYELRTYFNGSLGATILALSGTLANGSTVVYKNNSASLYLGTATPNTTVNQFNGDDAIVLYKTSTSTFVDIIGRIGEDPGTEWSLGGNSTKDKTLVRKANIASGVSTNPASGFPTLSTEWDQYNTDDVSHLGSHTFTGTSLPSYITGYENLSVTATSQDVTGLTPNSTYYYRVRSQNTCGSSGNSNVVAVTTKSLAESNLRSKQTGPYTDANTWEYDPGCGASWVAATFAPGADNNVTITSPNIVTLDASSVLNTGKTLTVAGGGTFEMADKLLTGAGAFVLQSGATLSIGDPAGITSSGATGNVQVSGSRSFSSDANYTYTGSTNQATGVGLPTTVGNLSFTGNALYTISNQVAVGGAFSNGASSTLSFNGNPLILNGDIANITGSKYYGTSGGSLSIGGTGTLSGDFVFASGGQNIGSLTLDRAGKTVTLGSNVSLSGTLTLINGLITSTATNLLSLTTTASISGGGTTSYINGQLRRYITTSAASYFFPLGTQPSDRYKPLTFNALNTLTAGTYFTGEYKYAPPPEVGNDNFTSLTLTGISNTEYWQFDRSAGSNATGKIVLPYVNPGSNNWRDASGDPLSPCAACNVAIVRRSTASGAGNWDFFPGSGGFSTSGTPPETRIYTANGDIISRELTTFSPFTFGFGQNTILPVRLLSFSAILVMADGKLEWKVADSKDLDGFELEYSRDGRRFTRQTSLRANSSNAYSYLHTDLPAGVHYYRLLVKDKDGTRYYSAVLSLTVGALRSYLIGVSPTLVNSSIVPVLFSAKNQPVQVLITDLPGRLHLSEKLTLQTGANQLRIYTGGLARGMYFITLLTSDGVKETRKFIKE